MNSQQFAKLINGRQRGSELTREEEKIAKTNGLVVEEIAKTSGLVVVFGYSDDCAEFRGAVDDELGAYDGGEFHFFKDKSGGVSVATLDQIEGLKEEIQEFGIDVEIKTAVVKAEWDPDDVECAWRFVTELPSEKFHIYEGEDLFCIGLVIAVSDILDHINRSHGE